MKQNNLKMPIKIPQLFFLIVTLYCGLSMADLNQEQSGNDSKDSTTEVSEKEIEFQSKLLYRVIEKSKDDVTFSRSNGETKIYINDVPIESFSQKNKLSDLLKFLKSKLQFSNKMNMNYEDYIKEQISSKDFELLSFWNSENVYGFKICPKTFMDKYNEKLMSYRDELQKDSLNQQLADILPRFDRSLYAGDKEPTAPNSYEKERREAIIDFYNLKIKNLDDLDKFSLISNKLASALKSLRSLRTTTEKVCFTVNAYTNPTEKSKISKNSHSKKIIVDLLLDRKFTAEQGGEEVEIGQIDLSYHFELKDCFSDFERYCKIKSLSLNCLTTNKSKLNANCKKEMSQLHFIEMNEFQKNGVKLYLLVTDDEYGLKRKESFRENQSIPASTGQQ
jgi:hypothetical protein